MLIPKLGANSLHVCLCLMQVEQVVPLPSHEQVTSYGALPSAIHPSDHLSLVCDLRLPR